MLLLYFSGCCCQTLELLFRITNAQNVNVIVEKMLGFLRLCNDEYTIINLVGKVVELAEKYPSCCNKNIHYNLFKILFLLLIYFGHGMISLAGNTGHECLTHYGFCHPLV